MWRPFTLAAAVALAGCIPLAGSYVHLEAPGIRHVEGICRDIGPPAIATWDSGGVRFELILRPLFESSKAGSYLRVRARKDADVRLAEPQGRLYRREGASTKEWRFGLLLREADPMRYESALGPTATTWHTFSFTGLPPIDFSGRLELPLILVDGKPIPMPAFDFEIRPWATFAPLNC
jgi:hypothetical protein